MKNEITNSVNQDLLIHLAKSADIQELDFSVRTFNALKRSGINTIGELCQKTYKELTETKLVGKHSIDEIHVKLEMIGLCLRAPEGRVATKDDWKRVPLPYTSINTLIYLPLKWYEIEKLKMGFIPVDMDCKWFLYYEDGKLYFYRSSSGKCYYTVTIDETKFMHIFCVIARSEVTWQSPESKEIATPVCGLVRNDSILLKTVCRKAKRLRFAAAFVICS